MFSAYKPQVMNNCLRIIYMYHYLAQLSGCVIYYNAVHFILVKRAYLSFSYVFTAAPGA